MKDIYSKQCGAAESLKESRCIIQTFHALFKFYVNQIGLNPNEYAGHSLRSGFVTSAAVHNARLDKIMEITRHKNPSTVMKYIRDIDSFRNHAGLKFL